MADADGDQDKPHIRAGPGSSFIPSAIYAGCGESGNPRHRDTEEGEEISKITVSFVHVNPETWNTDDGPQLMWFKREGKKVLVQSAIPTEAGWTSYYPTIITEIPKKRK